MQKSFVLKLIVLFFYPYGVKIIYEEIDMFKLHSNFKPTGDQPEAIEYLSNRNKRR